VKTIERPIVESKSEEELFAEHKRRTERSMKIAVAILAVVLLTVLYILLTG
jgi:hypothetical protein